MSASLRLVLVDLDEGSILKTYVLDNGDAGPLAVDMDTIAAQVYSQTSIVPRELDGTPYWGASDEEEVNA